MEHTPKQGHQNENTLASLDADAFDSIARINKKYEKYGLNIHLTEDGQYLTWKDLKDNDNFVHAWKQVPHVEKGHKVDTAQAVPTEDLETYLERTIAQQFRED